MTTLSIRQMLAVKLCSAWLETGVEPDMAYCQNTADLLLADVVLPLLAEKDAEIERLETMCQRTAQTLNDTEVEVEKLEARTAELEARLPTLPPSAHALLTDEIARVEAERDAALAEIERLRRSAVVVQSVRESELLAVINERNAATDEVERLRRVCDHEMAAVGSERDARRVRHPRMEQAVTAPTLRQLMADVIADLGFTNGDELVIADALLADPTFAAIIDLALVGIVDGLYADPPTEIRALLVDAAIMTPTRDELVSRFYATNHGTWEEAADVVLPLLAEKDAEIERLTVPDSTVPWVATLLAQMIEIRAERDAALAELGACRDSVKYQDAYTERVDAELAAALAEIERLRAALERVDESTYYLPHINEAVSDSTAAEVREEANAILDAIVAERPVWGDR